MSNEMNEQEQQTSDETINDETTTANTDEAGVDITQTKAYQGILRDLKGERSKRQELEQSVEALHEQLQQDAGKQTEEEKIDDEDLLTVGQFRKLQEKEKKAKAAEEQKSQRTALDRKFLSSEEQARTEFTAEKMGSGLDFDTVLENGFKAMATKNPAYWQVVVNSDNPAREAYEIGLRHPDIAKKHESFRGSKLLEGLNKGKNYSRTSGGGGGADMNDISKLSELPESELLKQIQAAGDSD